MSRLSIIGKALGMLLRPGSYGPGEKVPMFCRAFAERILGNASIPCYMAYRARVLLWAVIRALGLKETDEVIVPAYTCEMVPTAIRFAGARCVYVDCAQGSWSPDDEIIMRAVTPRTRLVLLQHTYGIVQPAEALRRRLPDQVAILEDACQVVEHARLAANRPHTLGALFSLQWNKPMTTGLGGVLSVHNEEFSQRIGTFIAENLDRQLAQARVRGLALQMIAYQSLLTPATRASLANIYRWLQISGLIQGTTSPREYTGAMPADYALAATDAQAVLGEVSLSQWPQVYLRRRELTKTYLECLLTQGFRPFAEIGQIPVLWGVPLQSTAKQATLRIARQQRLALTSWFGRAPAHLAPQTASQYGYVAGACPKAEALVTREVFLSTASEVSDRRLKTTCEKLLAGFDTALRANFNNRPHAERIPQPTGIR